MRLVTFKSVIHGCATVHGSDPTVDLNRNEAAAWAEYINRAMDVAWRYYPWPETVVVEQRTAVDQLISYTQVGEAEISEVFRVTVRDPYKNRDPQRVPFSLNGDGIILPADYATSELYVEFRARPPVFESAAYVAANSYAIGDKMYFTDGDSYVAVAAAAAGETPVTDAAKWSKIEFPYLLANAVKAGAGTLKLQEEGQHSTSTLPDRMMVGYLEQEIEMLLQQRQSRNYQVGEFAV